MRDLKKRVQRAAIVIACATTLLACADADVEPIESEEFSHEARDTSEPPVSDLRAALIQPGFVLGPFNKLWVDTFGTAPGFEVPWDAKRSSGGVLYAGRNYVYCKLAGRRVSRGAQYNDWWLLTDLDTGTLRRQQFVSAYFLTRWGNNEARDNSGRVIPNCEICNGSSCILGGGGSR